jgi:hypothetical protein
MLELFLKKLFKDRLQAIIVVKKTKLFLLMLLTKELTVNIFVQLGFSSNVTSGTVALTNFIKNFNFCGGLYFNSLVAKPLSNLYYDSSSNFQQSNDRQKVQYNTDLLSQRHSYLYRVKWHLYKTKWKCKMVIKKEFLIRGEIN